MDKESLELTQYTLSIAHTMSKNKNEEQRDYGSSASKSSQLSTISQLQKKAAQKYFT